MSQHMLNPGMLLNSSGELEEAGFSKTLIKTYDRKQIRGNKTRIKEWDYYLIYDDMFGIALTIADNSYMGFHSVSLIDFIGHTEITLSPMTLLPMGRTNLPPSSSSGNVSFRNKKIDISFSHVDNGRRLYAYIPDEKQEPLLEIDVLLTDEPEESMVIATPFKEKKTAFYYNQKIVGMRAAGSVLYHGQRHEFAPEDSFGILDWGRGVWTYKNTWYWSAASGMADGHRFGFNLGYGFGDTSAASENMLFYDGTAHKLDQVTFHIPGGETGQEQYMKPWTFTSSDKRFEMNFEPILDRCSNTDVLLIASRQHQVFGYFSGQAVLDNGQIIELDHFLGFAEKVSNKW